jgi:hypothetical protein
MKTPENKTRNPQIEPKRRNGERGGIGKKTFLSDRIRRDKEREMDGER